MAMNKYGMKHTTIRYHQNHARDLWRYNGIRVGHVLSAHNATTLATADPREIAYAAIGLAVSTGPLTIARILAGDMLMAHGGAIILASVNK